MSKTYTSPEDDKKAAPRRAMLSLGTEDSEPVVLSDERIPDYMRTGTGISEFDRALGGGIVEGSAILLTGEPGIGKSTFLLQLCASLAADAPVLYVSGEESAAQISMRAKRLGIKRRNIYLLTETNTERILAHAKKLSPSLIIVDSIQTVYHTESMTVPGSVTQIRECAAMFINKAKTDGTSVILVGHINKEGGIAGPKILEHMVDTVLYFEGDGNQNFRVIRAMKNRFGSTNEIGVFEMTDAGLKEVPSPSEMLLRDRPRGVSGNCAVAISEGTRPLIAEIQVLATPTVFPSPRRMSSGIDNSRMSLLIAVLEKRLNLKFYTNDVYLNVIGGIRIDETAADAGTALAMISSIRDIPVPEDLICIGEIGLSGEIRAVSRVDRRIGEAIRLGFTQIAIPHGNAEKYKAPEGIRVIPLRSVFDLLKLLSENKQK